METLSDSQEEILTSKIKYLVRDFWADNRWKLTIIATIYWIYAFLASIHIIWCHELETCHKLFNTDSEVVPKIFRIATLVILMVCYVLLVLYELIVLMTQGSRYFTSLDNYIDILGYVFFLPSMGVQFLKVFEETKKLPNFLLAIYLLLLGIRAITYMRVFDGMRYMIKMLIQVFMDMREFLTLLIITMIVFGSIETMLTQTITEASQIEAIEPF